MAPKLSRTSDVCERRIPCFRAPTSSPSSLQRSSSPVSAHPPITPCFYFSFRLLAAHALPGRSEINGPVPGRRALLPVSVVPSLERMKRRPKTENMACHNFSLRCLKRCGHNTPIKGVLDGWYLISSRTPFRSKRSVDAISQETLSGLSLGERQTDEQATPGRLLSTVERPHFFDNFKAKSVGATGGDNSRNT